MKISKFAVACLVALSFLSFPTGSFADEYLDNQPKPFETIDPGLAAVYGLTMCTPEAEIDCIESVSTKASNGTFIESTVVNAENWSFLADAEGVPVREETGNFAYRNSIGFQYLDENGDPQEFSLSSELETPAHIIFENLVGGALRIFAPDLGDRAIQIKVRTSWLKPQNIQLVADDANFETEAISGGNRWVFEGKSTEVISYLDWELAAQNNYMDAGDVSSRELHFFIHHAGIDSEHSYFPPDCADDGYTVQAFNSNAAGSPEWNNETGSLDFNIVAPHLNLENELNHGFFKLWVNDEFVNCRWPENTLTSFDSLVAKVLNENGSEQEGVSVTTTHVDGQITLATEGFHYSSPTIQLKGLKKPRRETVETVSQKPFSPSFSDIDLNQGQNSISVSANYSGMANSEPETYEVKVSPGGNSCVIRGASSSCEVIGLKTGVEYTVSISATNKFGTSAATVLPSKYILTEAGLLRYESKKTLPGFAGDSAKFTKDFQSAIKKYINANTDLSAVTCTGYTAGPVKQSDKVLAKTRASNVCAYIEKIKPSVSTTTIGKTPGLPWGPANRKVVIRGYSALG